MLPGAPVADAVFADLRPRIEKLLGVGHTPGLGTVLVGDDGASERYVGMKHAEGRGARLDVAAPPLASGRNPGRRRRRDPSDERRPARRRVPRAAPHAAADRL